MNENALQKIEPQTELPAIVQAPITPAQAKIDAVANLTMKAYERASTLKLTPEEIAALQADFPDEAFKPGAAGKEHLIYIEHAFLRDRLSTVLGIGQWSIVPRNRWAEDFSFVNKYKQTVEASRVYVEAMLCVRGCFVAEAIGDMVYYKNNESQNYGDAVEGAKTDALRRCAKELSVGLQPWKKDFCQAWWDRRNGKRPATDNVTARQSTAKVPQSEPQKAGKAPPDPSTPATEEQRVKWVKQLKAIEEQAVAYGYANGILLPPGDNFPGEPLECWGLEHTPSTKWAAEKLFAKIQAAWRPSGTAEPPSTSHPQQQSSPESQPEPKNGISDGPEAQAWFTAIVPVPYAGMKRDQYLKKPDTIGELYNLRHDDDQARRRLFGFLHNFEPKGWKNREGKQMPPSASDKKFRDDLDAFGEWFEANHPDEVND